MVLRLVDIDKKFNLWKRFSRYVQYFPKFVCCETSFPMVWRSTWRPYAMIVK